MNSPFFAGIRRRLSATIAVCLAAATIIPATAFAGDGTDLREAGSDDRFRVVERFPDGDDEPVDLPAVDDESPFGPVVDKIERREWSTAFETIESAGVAEAFSANPIEAFAAGYVAFEAGEFDRALEYFETADDLEVVDDYRAYYAARAAMEIEDVHRATIEAARVGDESPLYPDALMVLSRALDEAGEAEDRRRAD